MQIKMNKTNAMAVNIDGRSVTFAAIGSHNCPLFPQEFCWATATPEGYQNALTNRPGFQCPHFGKMSIGGHLAAECNYEVPA